MNDRKRHFWLLMILLTSTFAAYHAGLRVRRTINSDGPKPEAQWDAPTDSQEDVNPLIQEAKQTVESARCQWSRLESTNYFVYMSNLQSIECPSETIADIIVADVNALYRSLYGRLFVEVTNAAKAKYWESEQRQHAERQFLGSVKDKLRHLERDRRIILKKLLGSSYHEETDVAVMPNVDVLLENRDFGFLSENHKASYLSLQARFDARVQNQFGSRDLTAEDVLELENMRQQHENQLLLELGPEVKREVDLRHSETAHALRASLGSFEPTEQEFVSLFETARRTEELRRQARHASDSEWTFAETALRNEAIQQLRQTLGEARAAEFLQTSNASFLE